MQEWHLIPFLKSMYKELRIEAIKWELSNLSKRITDSAGSELTYYEYSLTSTTTQNTIMHDAYSLIKGQITGITHC